MAYCPCPNKNRVVRHLERRGEGSQRWADGAERSVPALSIRIDPRVLALYDDIGTQVAATANALCEASRQARGRA